MKAWGALALVVTIGCGPTLPTPVDIEAYDMCAFCRMAISQKQFAAEIIDPSGSAQKFDDIGCMLRFLHQQKIEPGAVFVIDYRTRRWLEAPSAFYVRSDKLQTPMGGGFAAFADRAGADAAAREFHASVLAYAELTPAERSGL